MLFFKNIEFLYSFLRNFYVVFFLSFFLQTKTSKDLCARNYQKNKSKIQRKSRERYQNLFEEEKNENREYCRERYKIIC